MPDQPKPTLCDARGHQCPIPVLKASKQLASLSKGQRLTLLATDPMAAIDVPHMCNQHGYRLVATQRDDDTISFLIEII